VADTHTAANCYYEHTIKTIKTQQSNAQYNTPLEFGIDETK